MSQGQNQNRGRKWKGSSSASFGGPGGGRGGRNNNKPGKSGRSPRGAVSAAASEETSKTSSVAMSIELALEQQRAKSRANTATAGPGPGRGRPGEEMSSAVVTAPPKIAGLEWSDSKQRYFKKRRVATEAATSDMICDRPGDSAQKQKQKQKQKDTQLSVIQLLLQREMSSLHCTYVQGDIPLLCCCRIPYRVVH